MISSILRIHQYPHHSTNVIDNNNLQTPNMHFHEPKILYLHFLIPFLFLKICLVFYNEMQSTILKLFEEKKLFKEIGRNSYKRINERYSDKNQLKKVISFISSLKN